MVQTYRNLTGMLGQLGGGRSSACPDSTDEPVLTPEEPLLSLEKLLGGLQSNK